MSQRPVLLFYCQHSLGMGHLVRSLTLAETLAEYFQVVFLNGGRFPSNAMPPEEITAINLPPLGMGEDNQLYSQDERYSVLAAQAIRREMILNVFEHYEPDALLIELFPFGRKKFAYELLPLLKAARRINHKKTQVFCSLRDIMVNIRKDQLRHDNRARWLADRYFDGVLVHSDPKFARLEESFHPSRPLKTALSYTGFVLPRGKAFGAVERKHQLLVSAGGGMVGGALLQLAARAQPMLWSLLKLPATLVAGPFLPENEWRQLNQIAKNCPGLTLLREVPNMTELLQSHSVSVSQCGYNTVMDILKSGIAALVVPFAKGRENEQTNRAERMKKLGLLKTIAAEDLNPERFVYEVEQLLSFSPSTVNLNLEGARQSAEIIHDQVLADRIRPLANSLKVERTYV